MPDSSDIDNALVARLGSDPTLLGLCPNGVYFDVAPPGATRFVVVTIIDAEDVAQFGGRAYEDKLYSVTARMLSTVVGANIKAAAARIDLLLEDQPLTVTGYAWMATHRERPIRLPPDVDDQDTTLRWANRGGYYRVQMSIGNFVPASPSPWMQPGWTQ